MDSAEQQRKHFTVIESNHMESLADMCSLIMAQYPLNDPMIQEKIVVMNQGMQEFLSQRIAYQNQVMAMCKFSQLWSLIFETFHLVHVNQNLPYENYYSRDTITWNIFSTITGWKPEDIVQERKLKKQQKKQCLIYERLYSYCEHDAFGDKAYDLSAKIADTFDLYQIYRPYWINFWNNISLRHFDEYEQNPEDEKNPINIFINEQCKNFSKKRALFALSKSKQVDNQNPANNPEHQGSSNLDKLDVADNADSIWQEDFDLFKKASAVADVDALRRLFKNNVWQIRLWASLRNNINFNKKLLIPKGVSIESLKMGMPELLYEENLRFIFAHLDRSQIVLRMTEELRRLDHVPNIFPRVFFFGISALPKIVIDWLDALSRHTQVYVMMLSPCSEYWADLSSNFIEHFDKFTQKIQATRLDPKVFVRKLKRKCIDVPAINLKVNSFESDGTNSNLHPLLLAYGKQGRDTFSALYSLSDLPNFIQVYSEPEKANFEFENVVEGDLFYRLVRGGTLLSRVQSCLLTSSGKKERYVIADDDHSFIIHSCHTKKREIEVLKDTILSRFNEAKMNHEVLLPKDIVVMVPVIQDYIPYIHAVFGSDPDSYDYIPYIIADQTSSDENTIAQALLKLLMISSRRVTAPLIIDLLTEPAIANRFGLSQDDVHIIEVWLQENNVHWGLDQEDVKNYSEIDLLCTLEQGLNRMLLGSMLGECEEVASYTQIEGSDCIILGKLWDFVRSLRELRDLFTPELSLTVKQWSAELDNFIGKRFFDNSPETQEALNLVNTAIADMQKVVEHLQRKPPVNLSVFAKALAGKLSSQRVYQPFLKGKVNFCSLVPMRAVPFKQVYILGLNDGQFPRQDDLPGFNLMASTYLFERGDRSRIIEDRYLFLESLLSARDNLYLSFIGQNPIDKSSYNPSIVLSELISYLLENCTTEHLPREAEREQAVIDRIIVKDHLNAYNFNNYAVNQAYLSWQKPSFNRSFIQMPNTVLKDVEYIGDKLFYRDFGSLSKIDLELDELKAFVDNPASGFIRDVLHIRIQQEEESQVEHDELFVLNNFSQTKIANTLALLPRNLQSSKLKNLIATGNLPYGVFQDNEVVAIKDKLFALNKILYQHKLNSLQDIVKDQEASFDYVIYLPQIALEDLKAIPLVDLVAKYNMPGISQELEQAYTIKLKKQQVEALTETNEQEATASRDKEHLADNAFIYQKQIFYRFEIHLHSFARNSNLLFAFYNELKLNDVDKVYPLLKNRGVFESIFEIIARYQSYGIPGVEDLIVIDSKFEEISLKYGSLSKIFNVAELMHKLIVGLLIEYIQGHFIPSMATIKIISRLKKKKDKTEDNSIFEELNAQDYEFLNDPALSFLFRSSTKFLDDEALATRIYDVALFLGTILEPMAMVSFTKDKK